MKNSQLPHSIDPRLIQAGKPIRSISQMRAPFPSYAKTIAATPVAAGVFLQAVVFALGLFSQIPAQAEDIPATYKWRAVSGTDPSCESTPTPSTCYDSAAAACQHYWGTYYLGFRLDNPPWNNYAYCQYRNIYGDPAWAFTWGNAIADLFCPVGYRLASYTPTCSPICGPNQQFLPDANNGAGACVDQTNYKLSLTPDGPSTEPSTDLGLTVTVEDQNHQPPKNPVTVKISLKVDSKSGGHDHGDGTRPRGGIDNTTCETDDTCKTISVGSSERITFNARDASGIHTVTATCEKCSNSPQKAEVKVMVEGLEPIPAFPYYALEESDPDNPGQTKVIGATSLHRKNHYLLPAAAGVLMRIAVNYHFHPKLRVLDWKTNTMVLPPLLHVNDASLEWGGKFDIKGKWTGAHEEHKRGTSVDLRANEKVGAIPPELFDKFEERLMEIIPGDATAEKFLRECTPNEKPSESNPNPIQHNRKPKNYCVSQVDGSFDDNRHYHVRLMGE